MNEMASAQAERTLRDEVARIVDDISLPADDPESIPDWEVRSLHLSAPERAEVLPDGSPRWLEVALIGHGYRFADMAEKPGYRDEKIADWIQDAVVDATTEARPRCPRHGSLMAPWSNGAPMIWRCNRDSSDRCAIGTYWSWSNGLKLGAG